MGTVSTGKSKFLDIQLRTVRQAAGLTRTELAARAGVTRSTVYLLEDGLLDTRISTLLKVAQALGVTPDYLLGLRKAV